MEPTKTPHDAPPEWLFNLLIGMILSVFIFTMIVTFFDPLPAFIQLR